MVVAFGLGLATFNNLYVIATNCSILYMLIDCGFILF